MAMRANELVDWFAASGVTLTKGTQTAKRAIVKPMDIFGIKR
jgi:hypothetical protein